MPLTSANSLLRIRTGKPDRTDLERLAKNLRLSRYDSSHRNSSVLDSPSIRNFCSRGALTRSFPLVSSARPGSMLGAAGEPSRWALGL